MNTTHTLTYEPVMWSRDGIIMSKTNPVCRYEVHDGSGRRVGYITNARADSRPPCWEISRLRDDGTIGDSTGEYASAEQALIAFQQQLDA